MTHPYAERWRAIIAEADSQSAARLKECVRFLGFDVVTVSDPERVAETLGQSRGTLVLAALPDVGGDAERLCREWRAGSQRCYIIFLLEQYRAEAIAAAFEAGADDVLAKPVIVAELRARVRRAADILMLEQYRERMNGEAVLLAEIAARAQLHSRRYLQAQLSCEVNRARRFTHALAFILVEVALVPNDEKMLRSFGVFLNDHLRQDVDWVARYTDRIFGLVLPETTMHGAVRVAHRLRAALHEAPRISLGRLPSQLKISFGVSALDEFSTMEPPDTTKLMESAEAHLREAVSKGPDQIVGGRPTGRH